VNLIACAFKIFASAQDPAGIGAKGLELLVEAVEAGNIGEVGVVPDMTPVDSVLVTKE